MRDARRVGQVKILPNAVKNVKDASLHR